MKTKAKLAQRERFKLSEFANPSGQIAWRVSGTKKDGSRVRENFKTKDEAEAKKQELEVEAENHKALPWTQTRLTPDQVADAERATAELKPGFDLLTAVRFFNENYQDPLKPSKLADAVTAFLAGKKAEGVRDETYNNLRFRLNAFVAFMPVDKMVHEIMADQIEGFLFRVNGKERGKRTIKNDRLALSNLFTWAADRKHCVKNPMLSVKKVRAGSNKPEVFNLPTVRKLLKAAMEYENGKCVPYYILGLFCGLRPTETERLAHGRIDLKKKHIFIDEKTAKVTKGENCNERYVTLEDNAIEWLTRFASEQKSFAIDRKDFDAIKKAAGLDEWPQDVLRHTAISNFQAHHKHEGETAEWAGNSVKVVRKHYRRAVEQDAAAAFWQIKPDILGE